MLTYWSDRSIKVFCDCFIRVYRSFVQVVHIGYFPAHFTDNRYGYISANTNIYIGASLQCRLRYSPIFNADNFSKHLCFCFYPDTLIISQKLSNACLNVIGSIVAGTYCTFDAIEHGNYGNT